MSSGEGGGGEAEEKSDEKKEEKKFFGVSLDSATTSTTKVSGSVSKTVSASPAFASLSTAQLSWIVQTFP